MASNKAKKTSSSQSHSVQSGTEHSTAGTEVNVPDWLLNPAQKLAGGVEGLLGQGAGAYTPGVSNLQKQAFAGAANLGGGSPYLDEAAGLVRGIGNVTADQVKGESLLDNLEGYYNPFKEQITNPVLEDYDYQSGLTRASQAADAARGKAFQGSRYGIREGQTEEGLARGRAATEGGLLSQMFDTSTRLSGEDAGRRQQAALANQSANLQAGQGNQRMALDQAGVLRGLGMDQGSETRANLGIQAGLGGVQTDQENAIRQYPIEYQQQMEGLLKGLDPASYFGRTVTSDGTTTGVTDATGSGTETSSPGLISSLGQVAKIASLFMPTPSDERVKQDVETVGYDAKGRRWVSFAYIWAPWKRFVGLIAQEVRQIDPQAVLAGPGGVLMVDYGRLA